MNVLVVGAAGYIGSITTEQLLKTGHNVVAFDNLSKGHMEALPEGARFEKGDLADRDWLYRLFQDHNIDAVMHFAAHALVGESMQDPGKYFTNNVANTINLLGAMLDAGVKKFIFSSSAATYGEPEFVPITESHPLHPTNPYGETKAMVEKVLYWYDQRVNMRYASLRYFNAAGASETRGEDHDPETHIIPIVLQAALGLRERVEIFGTDYPTPDGTCVRDYVHVIDLAQAHILALEALDRGSGIYNLGNGNGYSVREVIEVAKKVTGRDIEVVESPRRPGDPAVLVASSEKAMKDLGWKPQFASLETIVATAWKWHSEHPSGYSSD